MLIDEHAYADAGHVEPIEKVLYGALGGRVHVSALVLLHLDDALRHRLDNIVVAIPNEIQIAHKSARQRNFKTCNNHFLIGVFILLQILVGGFDLLVLQHILEALHVPGAHLAHGTRVQQIVRQQGDLLHDIRQTHGQLLAQKYKRFLFACILACKRERGGRGGIIRFIYSICSSFAYQGWLSFAFASAMGQLEFNEFVE